MRRHWLQFAPLLAAALVVGGCSLTRPPEPAPPVLVPPPAGIDLPSIAVPLG